ncbi:MAG: type II toxin-antitoxin system VapC family toxin [Betaproteobacteria bacterium]|nr:type II toxin-antitoxin system VapC family toxin [Betaproteobacteria bacterium]
MILYLDTSAMVKLYVRERGSSEVRTLIRESAAVATSVVAYAETRAAFARLMRQGATVEKRHHERLKQFNADWESLMRVELGHVLARSAGELAEAYALRGFDAIHLATALWLNDTAGGKLRFAAFDAKLHAAARRAGLPVAV